MNNLDMIQEASLGTGEGAILNFGPIVMMLIPPTQGFSFYGIKISGDELIYEFDRLDDALDFACDEARLAATVH